MTEEQRLALWIQLMHFFGRYWGCHQTPQRSFSAYGYQFPLCARCTGILLGELVAIILLITGCFLCAWTALLLMAPMIADGSVQLFYDRYESTNIRRLVTGTLFGVGLGFLLFQLITAII